MRQTALRNASLLAVLGCAALVTSGTLATNAASPQPSSSSVTCAQYNRGGTDFPPLPTSLDPTCAQPPLDMVGTPGQPSADTYGWLTFIAMNWPVVKGRCIADSTKNIATAPANPTWLSYLQPDAVFVPSGRPAGWCGTPTGANGSGRSAALAQLPPRVRALAAKHPEVTLFLHHSAKSHDLVTALNVEQRRHLTGGMRGAPLTDPGLKGILDATDQPVTDQNGRFVRYTVAMNFDEYRYIIAKRLWTKSGQQAAGVLKLPQGARPGTSGPVGAMEFKAAWKILGKNDDPTHFFWQWAIVYNDDSGAPSPGVNPVKAGLVGLHITHKTAGQPNWLWTTFEQTDYKKGFNNPNCPAAQCPPNVQTAPTPYIELNPNGTPRNKPVQVVAATPPTAGQLNPKFQAMLGNSPWSHYEEISTQWSGNLGGPKPHSLGNPILETFVKQTVPYNCLGCHNFAHDKPAGNKSDFSFQIHAQQ
ncbi:MAG TPA: hypothetical protein VK669_09285 [Candidatus Limnocylindrales bacterium]|nr:hypothetical protein [Candidatus Limnocylindrales bacterium]